MSNKKSNGRAWPYILGGAITLVFGFCVATIVVTSKADIQESNTYMTYYQDADAKANDYITARIAFDKKYTIKYTTKSIEGKDPKITYRVTDKDGNIVKNAKLILSISRPETHIFDQTIKSASFENGNYVFRGAKFDKVGLWNLIAKVSVGDDYRFYNIKADTRIKESFEF